MTVRLEKRVWKDLENLEGHHWQETDYTGRWSIETLKGESKLYLECFYFKSTYPPKLIFKEKSFLFFKWKSFVGYKNNFKAEVEWISEYDLRLTIAERYINECGCYDQKD